MKLTKRRTISTLRLLKNNFMMWRGEDSTLSDFVNSYMPILSHTEKEFLNSILQKDECIRDLDQNFVGLKMARVRALSDLIKRYNSYDSLSEKFFY
jgi:hypothetical protein